MSEEFLKGYLEVVRSKAKSDIDLHELMEGRTVTREEVINILQDVLIPIEKLLFKNSGFAFSEAQKNRLEFDLCQRSVNVSDNDGTVGLGGGKVEPWLANKNIEWRLWDRYQRKLLESGISSTVIKQHENLINRALDLSGDPTQKGAWDARKGLVMGNVQAGKTLNFIGLINKALDVGYHTIIVLGGHMDELRRQAQLRVNEGLPQLDDVAEDELKYIPTLLTKPERDFNSTAANSTAPNLLLSPTILVMKKHTTILKRFIKWYSELGGFDKSKKKPFLLIDDEADYASINTKHAQEDYTSTNTTIRDLLNLFDKPTYVGYTATPFANVFIPYKNTTSGEFDDDLFPSDFMLKMPIPKNYHGQDFFFPDQDSAKYDPCRFIQCVNGDRDYGDNDDDWLPLKHKKDHFIYDLDSQLEEAILSFFIVAAVRYIRGETSVHNTMLVNVSRFNNVQLAVTELVQEYIYEIVNEIKAFGALPLSEAISNSEVIEEMQVLFGREFSKSNESFQEVLHVLVGQCHRVNVEMVNGLNKGKAKKVGLNYKDHPDGYWVVAVGGLKLSRGLTLEGLSVSFFLRNALAYDTLTQMCRWFGYRDGYEDLCRLYLLQSAHEHYTKVAQSIRELYMELRIMEATGGTPKDYGLKVCNSETGLLVTAKNKMGTAELMYFNYRLWGEAYSRVRAWVDPAKNMANFNLLENTLSQLSKETPSVQAEGSLNSRVYNGVSYSVLVDLIEGLTIPVSGRLNEPAPVVSALNALSEKGFPLPKILLFSRGGQQTNTKLSNLVDHDGKRCKHKSLHPIASEDIYTVARTFSSSENSTPYIYSTQSSIADSNDLKYTFTSEQLAHLDQSMLDKKLDNKYLRTELDAPVLIVYLVSSVVDAKDGRGVFRLAHGDTPTVMYVLHFPSKRGGEYIKEMDQKKSYLTNEVFQGIEYQDMVDEDAENNPAE